MSNKTYKRRPHRAWLILAYAAPGVLGAAWGLVTVLLITSGSWDPSYLTMYAPFLALFTITLCYWASTVQKRHRKNEEHPRK